MKFKTHNDEPVDVDGTCYQGEIETTFSKLRKVFGDPQEGDGYKVQAEWAIEFEDGLVATIYDWKLGPDYLGDEGIPPEDVVIWNIGGDEEDAVGYVKKALRS